MLSRAYHDNNTQSALEESIGTRKTQSEMQIEKNMSKAHTVRAALTSLLGICRILLLPLLRWACLRQEELLLWTYHLACEPLRQIPKRASNQHACV